MKIQSIQNQQMQNRPNFSADLRIKKLPNLLGGVRIDSSGLRLKDGSSTVVDVLKSLSAAFERFVGIDGPRETAGGANARHFISPTGDKVLLEKSLHGGEKPIGLVVNTTDGSEILLVREDIYFMDKNPTPSDKLFDDAAAVLNAKAVKPNETKVVEETATQAC